MPDLYSRIAERIGTGEARELAGRLSTWHDRLVMHERRRRIRGFNGPCPEGCPHALARDLWSEAVMVFGPAAHDLQLLKSRALKPASGVRAPAVGSRLAGAGGGAWMPPA